MDIVKSIIRRATRSDKLNIIVIGATHERYESELARTGHNFFCLDHGKQWETKYAPIPENYSIINQIPYHEEFDLILLHTSGERYNLARQIQEYCQIPILKHCHVLPQTHEEVALFQQEKVDLNSFISDFSKGAWGYDNALTIKHGLDTEFWTPGKEIRENHLLSVVNYWANRDWACGWNLWKSITGRTKMPIRIVGDNPGISKPAKNVTELRDIYQKSSIFLNTSLHSPVPMALLEAMACGCAIVSTATCMIPEIIQHGENGLTSNNPDELREYCNLLLEQPEMARNLGNKARETIKQKYNIEKFKNSWNEAFNKVLYK